MDINSVGEKQHTRNTQLPAAAEDLQNINIVQKQKLQSTFRGGSRNGIKNRIDNPFGTV